MTENFAENRDVAGFSKFHQAPSTQGGVVSKSKTPPSILHYKA